MDDLIVKVIARLIIPFVQIYGIFVVIHGHISPGGGFAGGSILGSSLIFYTLAYGIEKGHKKAPHHISAKIEAGGILFYLSMGFVSILLGYNFLTNQAAGFYMGSVGQILSAGLIPFLTIAIGMKVASTMITLFHTIIEEE